MPLTREEKAALAREHGKKGGRPKGAVSPVTEAKEEAREAARVLITAELDAIIQPQLARAKGLKYLVTRAEHHPTISGKYGQSTARLRRPSFCAHIYYRARR